MSSLKTGPQKYPGKKLNFWFQESNMELRVVLTPAKKRMKKKVGNKCKTWASKGSWLNDN